MAILNFTSLLGKNYWKKFRMAIFGHSKFIPDFLGKIVRKNLEWPFLAVLNFSSLSGKNCQKKFGMDIFGHSEFIPVFLGKIVRKNSEWLFLAIPNLYQSFWEKLSEKIWNGHSKFILVFWEKLSEKN